MMPRLLDQLGLPPEATHTIKHTVRRMAVFALAAAGLFLPPSSRALVRVQDHCTWPGEWPPVLAEISKSCRLFEVATGIQENVYEVYFQNRDEFEKLWPTLLRLKTPGAPIRLSAVGVFSQESLFSDAQPAVRIFAPAYGGMAGLPGRTTDYQNVDWEQHIRDGLALRSSPPWPADLIGPEGDLPEYVHVLVENGHMRWVPAEGMDLSHGFLHRARVELELVIDGAVIDLNRIPFPPKTPIVDRRFQGPPAP